MRRAQNSPAAILTQRTSWHNAELALKNLQQTKLLSLAKIAKLKPVQLRKLIKPAGFSQTKARRLIVLSQFVVKNYKTVRNLLKENTAELREKLLALYGIGPETADTILLYALAKPSFVIDEYTRRLVKKQGLGKELGYEHLQDLFEKNLVKNAKLYQDFHALIIISQRGVEKSRMSKF